MFQARGDAMVLQVASPQIVLAGYLSEAGFTTTQQQCRFSLLLHTVCWAGADPDIRLVNW